MKALFFLLFYFGLSCGLYMIQATGRFSKPYTSTDEPKEFYSTQKLKYYKNGNLKQRETIFYNPDGSEYQTIDEAFRRNGTRRDCTVMNKNGIMQYTKYNTEGHMKFERNYYYSVDQLESIETRMANGEIRIWTKPPPEIYGYRYAILY